MRSPRVEVDYGPSARTVAVEARAWLDGHAHEATGHVETRGVAPKGAWTQRLREPGLS